MFKVWYKIRHPFSGTPLLSILMKLKLSMSVTTECSETDLTTSQQVFDRLKHTPASVCMASTLTLDSVVKVPFSLHRLLGHDLKQVVGVRDDLCAD